MALSAPNAPDFDDLLARYRTARTQQPLFDVRPGAGSGYDEFIDPAGNVRPAWQEVAECVGERGRAGLDQLRAVVSNLVDNDGITYVQVGRHGSVVGQADTNGAAEPGPWHLDALPLVISAADWEILESGLLQRSRLLDAILADLYGPQTSVTGGVLPASGCSPIPAMCAPPAASRYRAATNSSCTAATSVALPTAASASTPTGHRHRPARGTRWRTGGWSRTPSPTSTSGSVPAPPPRGRRRCGWPSSTPPRNRPRNRWW